MSIITDTIERMAVRIGRLSKQVGNADKSAQRYVQSRGSGLITNGYGLLGDNTNFPAAVFSSVDTAAGFGSFQAVNANQVLMTEEYIAMDAGSSYRLSFAGRTVKKVGSSLCYALIACFDADEQSIDNHFLPFVTFRLAEDVKVGDTSVTVHHDDIAAVQEAMRLYANAALMYLCSGQYTNAKGYTYPVGSYTRTLYNATAKAGNTHTLNAASGVLGQFGSGIRQALSAGTRVGLSRTGGTYIYPVANLTNHALPEEWTRYSADISGSVLRAGTAFIKVGWLCNRSSQAGNVSAFSAINLREI